MLSLLFLLLNIKCIRAEGFILHMITTRDNDILRIYPPSPIIDESTVYEPSRERLLCKEDGGTLRKFLKWSPKTGYQDPVLKAWFEIFSTLRDTNSKKHMTDTFIIFLIAINTIVSNTFYS